MQNPIIRVLLTYNMASKLEQRLATINKADLTLVQFLILSRGLSESAPTMSALSRMLGHSTAAVTGSVDRLEKRGLSLRIFPEQDRRKVQVTTTESGKALIKSILEPNA